MTLAILMLVTAPAGAADTPQRPERGEAPVQEEPPPTAPGRKHILFASMAGASPALLIPRAPHGAPSAGPWRSAAPSPLARAADTLAPALAINPLEPLPPATQHPVPRCCHPQAAPKQ